MCIGAKLFGYIFVTKWFHWEQELFLAYTCITEVECEYLFKMQPEAISFVINFYVTQEKKTHSNISNHSKLLQEASSVLRFKDAWT